MVEVENLIRDVWQQEQREYKMFQNSKTVGTLWSVGVGNTI